MTNRKGATSMHLLRIRGYLHVENPACRRWKARLVACRQHAVVRYYLDTRCCPDSNWKRDMLELWVGSSALGCMILSGDRYQILFIAVAYPVVRRRGLTSEESRSNPRQKLVLAVHWQALQTGCVTSCWNRLRKP